MTTPAELRQLAREAPRTDNPATDWLIAMSDALRQAADEIEHLHERMRTNETEKWIDLHATAAKERDQARAEAERLRGERGTYMAALASTRDDVQKKIDAIDADNARLRRVLSDLADGAVDPSDRRIALAALDQEET